MYDARPIQIRLTATLTACEKCNRDIAASEPRSQFVHNNSAITPVGVECGACRAAPRKVASPFAAALNPRNS